MLCTACNTNNAVCRVSVFIHSDDISPGLKTVDIAHLCNTCVSLLTSKTLQLDKPNNAMSFDEALGSMRTA